MLRPLLSTVVFVGTLGFLAWYALEHLRDIPGLAWQDPGLWSNVAVAFLWYNLAAVVAAANWRWLLRSLGDSSKFGVAESVFLMTQAAKYLPGNVAHLIGRVAFAKARGIAVSVASASLLSEQVLAILAAALFLALGILFVPEALGPLIPYIPAAPWLAAALFGAALVPLFLGSLAAWISRWMPPRLRAPLLALRNLGSLQALGLVVLHWAAFMLLGAAIVAVARSVAGTPALDFWMAAVVFAGAWLIGYVMPGAPAGLGVREAVMVVGFAPMVGEGPALTIALAMRLVSVAGDASSFLIGFAGDRLLRQNRSTRDR